MSLLSDLAKYIATVIAIDAIAVALFLAAGGINLVRLQTERGLYILAINILLPGLPIGVIYWLYERRAALRRNLEVSSGQLNRAKGIKACSHPSAKEKRAHMRKNGKGKVKKIAVAGILVLIALGLLLTMFPPS